MALSLYDKAHLVAAAIRVLTHTQKTAPTLSSISELLGISQEETAWMLHVLATNDIVTEVTAGSITRYFLADVSRIETLPKQPTESQLDQELAKFKNARQEMESKAQSILAEQAEKQKSRFAEIEKKLKEATASRAKKSPT
uniref:Uncharacterized protein n=1 Tax=Desulfatirhabdium butyrativorans TaxID=340467 RepID=A0A7C4MR95_9BACT